MAPVSTLLSQALVAHTIELDNEFERRFVAAGAAARISSVVTWSNFLRFVGDGIAVGELPDTIGLPKARVLSALGGMERWRYVSVGPGDGKRDGYGSGRGLRPEWTVRPTPAGRAAAEIWPAVFRAVERRWRKRFGAGAVAELTASLRDVVAAAGLELPEFVPIVGSSDGMVAGLDPPAPRARKPPRHLAALLSQALLLYTLEFERESELSLPLSANVVRVLGERGLHARDLPPAGGISPEAVAMALTCLTRAGYVSVSAAKQVRLTAKGRAARDDSARLHRAVEKRLGVERLRPALEGLLSQREPLARGLEPPEGGWRASKPYAARTRALVEDPLRVLPHYPMVLHRGGWPDGS